MSQKWKNHLALTLVFFTLILLQQYLFYACEGLTIHWLTPGKYLGIFLFLMFFTFAKGRVTRFVLLSFIMVLFFFQMSHLSYFGTQILPSEIYLLFTQMGEIGGTLTGEVKHVIVPLAFTLVPLLLGWLALKKFHQLYEIKFVPVLFMLYFLYNPVRTYVTGNTWGRQPSTRELSGMNVYLSLSYFLGRILPTKVLKAQVHQPPNSSLKLELKEGPPSDWDKIIIVLGESLTPHHMQLFGYDRPTTPFLVSLKDQDHFFHATGLSSGVSTDISVAFFLNLGHGSAGSIKAAKGQHCLFRLAKEHGFKTHFLSIQSQEQLRYIAPYLCSSFLDDYKSLESIDPQESDHTAARDQKLLPHLKNVLTHSGKDFIILHQRGSHAPWNKRSGPEAQKFTGLLDKDQRVNDYDNSVVEFDLFWKELDRILSVIKEKVLVVYLSDHGEGLGENGLWGHGSLQPRAFEIPVLIQAFGKKLPSVVHEFPPYITHYGLGLFLAEQLGYMGNQSSRSPVNDYTVYGNDIDGLAGKAEVTFDQATYRFKFVP